MDRESRKQIFCEEYVKLVRSIQRLVESYGRPRGFFAIDFALPSRREFTVYWKS